MKTDSLVESTSQASETNDFRDDFHQNEANEIEPCWSTNSETPADNQESEKGGVKQV